MSRRLLRRDFRCSQCGYGAVHTRPPARCPMCNATDWRLVSKPPPAPRQESLLET